MLRPASDLGTVLPIHRDSPVHVGFGRANDDNAVQMIRHHDVLRQFELPQLRSEAERCAAGQLQDVLAIGALA